MIPLTKEIQRQVHFMSAQVFDVEDTSGKNNTWQYNRAPEGYLFELVQIVVSGSRGGGSHQGIVALFDGHEYTHWNIWPGVQSQEMLYRFDSIDYQVDGVGQLLDWECKEYTVGTRSWSVTGMFKVVIIVWYYLRKASRMELMEYALKHPARHDTFKRALRGTTVEPTEVET